MTTENKALAVRTGHGPASLSLAAIAEEYGIENASNLTDEQWAERDAAVAAKAEGEAAMVSGACSVSIQDTRTAKAIECMTFVTGALVWR